MKTWYRKISRDLDRPQGYLPRFNTDEREEPKPQTVTSPIIDTVETEEENSRTEEDSQSAHTTSPQTTSFKNKDEFKATMLPIYAKILSQMGLNTAYAKMLVAQDGLESAWGTKPSGKFNFGGIKGTGSIKRTREVIDGKDVYINDSFRDFASLEDYAKYKISLLNNNRYKAFTGDLSGFADRVSRGGYATDPNYAETLKRVIASAKHGGILKFQAGGTGEIRPDNRSWFKRKWDDIATAYNSSSWANSAPASIIAGFTPYGLFHYSASGDEDSARLAVLPGAGVLGNEVVSERRGGIIKAQQGADTRQWVDNWLSQRKDKLKNNAIYSGLFALPGLIKNPYFRQVKSMSKYSFKKGDLPGRTTGTTNHREKIITTSDDSKSTEVHEWTHAARPYEQIAKVKEIIDRWGLRPGIMRDDYLDKPSEIYSRLMELRYNNNLDPNHEYTLEEVRELRNKNHTGDYLIRTKNQYYKSNINNPSIPEKVEPIEKAIDLNLYKGAEELFERYNDSTIQSLLNDVAQVPNKRSAINYAKAGLKIPKYQNPASTIERTSEPWRVWNDYSNQGSMDPNWRVPLKKDPLPQKKYNVKRNYDKKAINDYGESYYDIVKTRVRDAHDALIRNGFSEDVKRLQEPLSAVSIKETGWRLTDPKNNYFGLLINGGKKASYKTKEESWDATIAYLNKRYGIGNLNGPWWESDSIEDFVNRINNPELDTTLHSQEDYDRYNRDRVTSGETPQYMHAPYWNNRNKRYNDEVKDIIDRYYGYYYME